MADFTCPMCGKACLQTNVQDTIMEDSREYCGFTRELGDVIVFALVAQKYGSDNHRTGMK